MNLSNNKPTCIIEERAILEEDEKAFYSIYPEYKVSLEYNLYKFSGALDGRGKAELILTDTPENMLIRMSWHNCSIECTYEQFCIRSTPKGMSVRTLAGRKIIKLLRLSYHWMLAQKFRPSLEQALQMLLQSL